MQTATAARARLVEHITNASDEHNLVALVALEETGCSTAEEKLVRGLITEHLYDKHPQVKAAYDTWTESLDDERTGSQVIADALVERRDVVGLAIETRAGIAVTAARVEDLIKHFGSGRVIAERDLVIHNHTLTAEGADMVRELAAKALAAADEQIPASETQVAPVLVLREEPALKTEPADEPGELPYEVADRDVSYQCGMRHDGEPTHGYVGWVEREHSDTYGRDLIDLEWVPFYEIQLPGDTEPSRFCEDCAGWLAGLAPHLLAEPTSTA